MIRRSVIKGLLCGLSVTASTKVASALPKELESAVPYEFAADTRVATLEELLAEPAIRGTKPAYPAEIALGKKILNGAPAEGSPIGVARYFEALRAGDLDVSYGEGAYAYGEEWPVRANPVIVSFFDATDLRTPVGDQTAWCAAFVNWCIDRPNGMKAVEGNRFGTRSAASATFRSWGAETSKPVEGDIVVFKHKHNSSRGHVGFYISSSSTGITVLGGNQMPARARLPDGTYDRVNSGTVNLKRFPFDGRDLAFHSFRTHPMLHI